MQVISGYTTFDPDCIHHSFNIKDKNVVTRQSNNGACTMMKNNKP